MEKTNLILLVMQITVLTWAILEIVQSSKLKKREMAIEEQLSVLSVDERLSILKYLNERIEKFESHLIEDRDVIEEILIVEAKLVNKEWRK